MKLPRLILALLLLGLPISDAAARPPACKGQTSGGCNYQVTYSPELEQTIAGTYCPGEEEAVVEFFDGDVSGRMCRLFGNS